MKLGHFFSAYIGWSYYCPTDAYRPVTRCHLVTNWIGVFDVLCCHRQILNGAGAL